MSRKTSWWKNQKVKLEQIDIISKFVAKQFSHKPLDNYTQITHLFHSIEQKENNKLAALTNNKNNNHSSKNLLKEESVQSKSMMPENIPNPLLPATHAINGKRLRENQDDEDRVSASSVSHAKKRIKILSTSSNSSKEKENDDSDQTTFTTSASSNPPTSMTPISPSTLDPLLIESVSRLLETFGIILKILIDHMKHAANKILIYYFDVLKVYVENMFIPSKYTYDWYCDHVNLLFRFLPQGEVILSHLNNIFQSHQVYPLYYILQYSINKLQKYDMVGVSDLRQEFWKRVENLVSKEDQREKIQAALTQLEENDHNFPIDEQLALLKELCLMVPEASQSRFYSDVYFLYRIKYPHISSSQHQYILAYGKTLVLSHPQSLAKLDEYDVIIAVTALPSSAVPELIPCPTSVDKPRPKRMSLPSTSLPTRPAETVPPPITSPSSSNVIPSSALPVQIPPVLPPQPNETVPTATETTTTLSTSSSSKESRGNNAFQFPTLPQKWCQDHVINYSDQKLDEITQIIREIQTSTELVDGLKRSDLYNCLQIFEQRWTKLQEYIYPESSIELYQLLSSSLKNFHKVAKSVSQAKSILGTTMASTSTSSTSHQMSVPSLPAQSHNLTFAPPLPAIPHPNLPFSINNQQPPSSSNHVFQNPFAFPGFPPQMLPQQRPPPPANPPPQRPPLPTPVAANQPPSSPVPSLDQCIYHVLAEMKIPLNSSEHVTFKDFLVTSKNRKITSSMVTEYAQKNNANPNLLVEMLKRLHQVFRAFGLSSSSDYTKNGSSSMAPPNSQMKGLRNSSLSIVRPSPVAQRVQSIKRDAVINLVDDEEENTNQVSVLPVPSNGASNVGEANGERDDDSLVSEAEEEVVPEIPAIVTEKALAVTNGGSIEERKEADGTMNGVVASSSPVSEVPVPVSTLEESSKEDTEKNGSTKKSVDLPLSSISTNGHSKENVSKAGQTNVKEKEEVQGEPLKTSLDDENAKNILTIIIKDLTRDGQIFKYAVTKEIWNTARLSKFIKRYFDYVKEKDPSKYDFEFNNMIIQPDELHKRGKELGLKHNDIIILRAKEDS